LGPHAGVLHAAQRLTAQELVAALIVVVVAAEKLVLVGTTAPALVTPPLGWGCRVRSRLVGAVSSWRAVGSGEGLVVRCHRRDRLAVLRRRVEVHEGAPTIALTTAALQPGAHAAGVRP